MNALAGPALPSGFTPVETMVTVPLEYPDPPPPPLSN